MYALHYHFVFIPKYRKPVLRGEIGTEVRGLIREICRTLDIEILEGHIRPDHVHLLLSVPPHLAPSRVMQAIKGKTSRIGLVEQQRWALCVHLAIEGRGTRASSQPRPRNQHLQYFQQAGLSSPLGGACDLQVRCTARGIERVRVGDPECDGDQLMIIEDHEPANERDHAGEQGRQFEIGRPHLWSAGYRPPAETARRRARSD